MNALCFTLFCGLVTLTGCGNRPQALDPALAERAEIFFSAHRFTDTNEITIEFSDDETKCPNIRIDNSLWRASNEQTKQNLVTCQLEKCLFGGSSHEISIDCFIFNRMR